MRQRGRKSTAKLAMIEANRVGSDLPADTLPPAHLTAETKAWWCGVIAEHGLKWQQLRVLEAACEAWDLMKTAGAALKKHGLTYTDDRGMVRQRPEAAIMRDARSGFLRCARELGLLKGDPPERDPNKNCLIGMSWKQMQELKTERSYDDVEE